MSVTKAGEQLLQTLGLVLDDIGAMLADLGRKRSLVSSTVCITANHHAFETVIRPVLPGFCADRPEASVEVLIDYGLRDILAERLDAGIRVGEKVERDMVAVNVGPEMRMAVVASPSFLAAHPQQQTPQSSRSTIASISG